MGLVKASIVYKTSVLFSSAFISPLSTAKAFTPTSYRNMCATRHLRPLGHLPALDVTSLEDLSQDQVYSILDATSQICRQLMQDLGTQWKPQPVDDALRARCIEWIKTEVEPRTGPVDMTFLASVDAGMTYTERVYEGGDFETKVSMVKYISIAIYLDDLIDKDAVLAEEASSFLVRIMDDNATKSRPRGHWFELYRRGTLELARHMSDPFVGNMLVHSCTMYLEGCALEYHIQQDQARYFAVKDIATEVARDKAERLAQDRGSDIPLPLDSDRPDSDSDYLVPHGWPAWLRERSAVAETFAISSFRAPGGVDVPTYLWVTAIPELRNVILSINDLLSFAKELLAGDTTSSLAVITKERRLIGMPGTAPDGGWCLRDSFDEVYGKAVVPAARINRLLRPSAVEARYGPDGRAYSIAELVELLKMPHSKEVNSRGGHEEVMRALVLKLWETHQKGYVNWHFQHPRYRAFELFGWVRDMMHVEPEGMEWLTTRFPRRR